MAESDDNAPGGPKFRRIAGENKGLKRQAEIYVKGSSGASKPLEDEAWAQFAPKEEAVSIPPPPAPRARPSHPPAPPPGNAPSSSKESGAKSKPEDVGGRKPAARAQPLSPEAAPSTPQGSGEGSAKIQGRASLSSKASSKQQAHVQPRGSRDTEKTRARAMDPGHGEKAPRVPKVSPPHMSGAPEGPLETAGKAMGEPGGDAKDDGRKLDALQREALNQDIRVKAQLITANLADDELQPVQPSVSHGADAVELSWGLRAFITVLIFGFCGFWVVLPIRAEMASRAEGHRIKVSLEAEASRFVDEMGKPRFERAVSGGDLRALLDVFSRFRAPAIKRLRAAGFRFPNTAFLIRQDFEHGGVVLGLVLEEGEGTLTVWSATHGKPFGRPIPDASYEAVSEAYGDDIHAAAWVVLGSCLFLWVVPMGMRVFSQGKAAA